jgi:hypothetical protein
LLNARRRNREGYNECVSRWPARGE